MPVAERTPLNESVVSLAEGLERRASREAQYWDLAGCEGPSPYTQALNEVDAAIGALKRARRQIQHMRNHEHRWGGEGFCTICGWDGNA